MLRFLCILLLFPLLIAAQEEKGINFEEGLTWKEILKKAKSEGKYVFVDCYATWCGPCKEMDKNVYNDDEVGEFFNSNFISVKVQMDKTDGDGEVVRNWYLDAEAIQKQYLIKGFPSYLFFNPMGEPVHRALGYKDPKAFLMLGREAVDSTKQSYSVYHNLLSTYREGKLDPKAKLLLAKGAQALNDVETANAVARDYIDNYIEKIKLENLTKEDVEFIGDFSSLVISNGSGSRLFKMLCKNADVIDKLVSKENFANWFVEAIIAKEEIEDRLWKDKKLLVKNPDWNVIRKSIVLKYGERYGGLVSYSKQIEFYNRSGNISEYVNLIKRLINLYPPAANGNKFSNAIGGLAIWGKDA